MTLDDLARTSWEPAVEGLDGDLELDPIERGIFSAVAYRDMFRFSPTREEIHRYMPFCHCSLDQVAERLEQGQLLGKYLCTDGTYYALAGRPHYFELRSRRAKLSADLLATAHRMAGIIASLPFVEMIAVSGSVAAENAGEDADVDLFVVIEGGHLWRTRLLLRLAKRLDHALGSGLLCPNSMRTRRALQFQWERLYIAHELQQMIPLYGLDVYDEVLQANAWTARFLPNARGRAGDATLSAPTYPLARRALESTLRSQPGQALEDWWRQRQISQFSRPGHPLSHYTPFTAEQEGLNLNVAATVERAHRSRLQWAGIHANSRTDSARSQ